MHYHLVQITPSTLVQAHYSGVVDDGMFGVFLDFTARKQAEEGHELLVGEMGYHVKNLLAIAAGLARTTSRSTSTTQDGQC